ncbi:type II toxin-antitoxin system RelE/ParE family toxin [Novosphingobium sp.]|uniref:type II toxin-antitoxin system RelE family toxin n=1 Tax=Novosphingobium sp. TaxID=1874826 RepID=UPI00286D452C|nr:type II toxin-antitoxin system RelE/ParE family toxin [Novosphingobium sp.]
MPTFEVRFRPRAAKAFEKLGTADKRQLAANLAERRDNPRVPGDAVRQIPNGYRLKLRKSGIRLIYQVRDQQLLVLVLAIGRREREEAYREALREYGNVDE